MELAHTDWVLLGGGLLGLLFGVVGQRSGFCLLRGFRHQWESADGRKLRAFALAMAVALAGTQVLAASTGLSLADSIYPQRSVSWLLIPLGGMLFGLGMTLANGCGARALVMLGTGNLRSLVVVMCLGVAAYMAMSGVLANARLTANALTSVQLPATTLPGLLAHWGLSARIGLWLSTGLLVTVLGYWALSNASFRRSRGDWLGGLLIGLMIPMGWWLTGVVGDDVFDPVRLASLTFVAPIGDTLQYLMIATGISLTFPVTVVTGIVVGSLVSTLISRQFRWQSFDSARHFRRSALGGALMGIGGVMALGCSIGQGLTGFSTLALTSFMAMAGIAAGAWLSIKGPLKPFALP